MSWTKRNSLVVTLVGLLANSVLAQTLLMALEQEIHNLVQVAKPSVVTIMTIATPEKPADATGLLGIFRERDKEAQQVKIGSGLIVSSDGFIVTKQSVVRNATHIEVTLADEKSLPAEVVALDSLSDIAVLKLSGEKLTPVRIGSLASVQPGSWVAVIGNALGMPQAISVGVVSGVQGTDLIQISANVDPGSNGSPVFNAQGKAIGIISGRIGIDQNDATTVDYFSGTALVYPLAPGLERLREIARHYYQTRGWLGVTVVADANRQGRPQILNLVKNSPAEQAGLQIGDVITHFAGQPIESFTQLREMVAARRPGARETLTVVRQDSVLNLTVQIGQQTPIALTELHPAPDDDSDTTERDGSKLPEQLKLEPRRLRQRIQALEKELRLLKSLHPKP